MSAGPLQLYYLPFTFHLFHPALFLLELPANSLPGGDTVDHYLMSLRGELPEYLHDILAWDFLPWNFIKNRHGDRPNTALIALLEAYSRLDRLLDLDSLGSMALPSDSGGCLRCGSCCTYMRPGAVSGKTYRKWEQAGVPVALFYSPVGKKIPHSRYNCWYNNGERLRMCPFLLMNRLDSRPFCSIHHLGREFRPRACSRFPPNPPVCQTGNFVPVP